MKSFEDMIVEEETVHIIKLEMLQDEIGKHEANIHGYIIGVDLAKEQ